MTDLKYIFCDTYYKARRNYYGVKAEFRTEGRGDWLVILLYFTYYDGIFLSLVDNFDSYTSMKLVACTLESGCNVRRAHTSTLFSTSLNLVCQVL